MAVSGWMNGRVRNVQLGDRGRLSGRVRSGLQGAVLRSGRLDGRVRNVRLGDRGRLSGRIRNVRLGDRGRLSGSCPERPAGWPCPERRAGCTHDSVSLSPDLTISKIQEGALVQAQDCERGVRVSLVDLRAPVTSRPAISRGLAVLSSRHARGPSYDRARARARVPAVRRRDTQRAWSRADALVSLAQGYLRGDRPDRSPIELTLTIAASSLGSAAEDPLELGELVESFLSPEAADDSAVTRDRLDG
jgi:hypothetical protein